jgi:hypothetical protein
LTVNLWIVLITIVLALLAVALYLKIGSLRPVGFKINEQALGGNMAKLKATVDLQILDDGKGVLFTLQPVNANGNPVPLPAGDMVSASSSATASLTVVPNPGDTTGLVFLGTVPQPPVDATDIAVTFSATNPIDVVADDSPAGFTITETAE